ncbi:MAG: EpsG family protein [Alistipes sp.]|nr:EpsG family protein [Alistipes sp.]
MNTIVFISVVCILLLLINRGNIKYKHRSLCAVFIFITVFLGIRYMFGSDYISYLYQYNIIKQGVDYSYSWYESILYNETPSEPGWVLLNRCFSSSSFTLLVFVLTVFECYILYKYIRKHVTPCWYWLSIFLFMVNPSNMLTCISMMRQYLAMTIFLIAIKYIITGKFIKYFILILTATFIHTSSIVLLPVYFLRKINLSFLNKKTVVYIIILFFVIWYIWGAGLFGGMINNLLGLGIFQRYALYANNDTEAISLGFSTVLYVLLFYHGINVIKNSTREEAILILIPLIGLLILPLGVNISLISRLSFYFTYALIFVIPIIFDKIKRREIRYLLILMMLAFYINSFISFFNSPTNLGTYSKYQTIFSTDLIL